MGQRLKWIKRRVRRRILQSRGKKLFINKNPGIVSYSLFRIKKYEKAKKFYCSIKDLNNNKEKDEFYFSKYLSLNPIKTQRDGGQSIV